MRITRLYLRNYRVYEDPLELEIPGGLVGIYGPNGAGKSALLESVLWTLWGISRTTKDEVRTSGVGGDCVTEVEFEHEGHLYLVRRALTGINATVRAEAHADRAQVAEGVRDTGRYVHSVLGMDDGAFRASVFAEQKQLAAFSVRRPAERRQLVLGLLGITPLDLARDQARKDARAARDQVDQLRPVLVDLDHLEAELAEERRQAEETEALAARAAATAQALGRDLAEAEAEHQRLDQRGRVWEGLVTEGRARRAERDQLDQRRCNLETDDRALVQAEAGLAALEKEVTALEPAQARLRLLEALTEARAGVEEAGRAVPVRPDRPDPEGLAALVEAAQAARSELAELTGRMAGARAERDRAAAALARSEELSTEGECPLCGRALGSAFEAVQSHRAEELAQAEATVSGLEGQRGAAIAAVEGATAAAGGAEAALVRAQSAWAGWERAVDRHQEAERCLLAVMAGAQGAGAVGAGAVVVTLPDPGERDELVTAVAAGLRAVEAASRVKGRLERRPALLEELAGVRARAAQLDGEMAELRERVRALDHRPEQVELAAVRRDQLRGAASEAAGEAHGAAVTAAQARARADSGAKRLDDARQQHRRLDQLGEEARHLGRTAELLSAFRNSVVATVGPRLSAQAAELFGELTDHEYDGLDVDPETYDIEIRDQGIKYGMDRFSGSETDLANLALRVAISEQVSLQSGGAVGLLVLDEVFGPLDDDRKERMLLALERLRGRFRQVLVVTHDGDIKEQLPSAIEVVKLPGRRAAARLV